MSAGVKGAASFGIVENTAGAPAGGQAAAQQEAGGRREIYLMLKS